MRPAIKAQVEQEQKESGCVDDQYGVVFNKNAVAIGQGVIVVKIAFGCADAQHTLHADIRLAGPQWFGLPGF